MNRFLYSAISMAFASLLCAATFAGCARDFVADPSRPRPTRAVQDPVESNSASAEARSGTAQGVPLVTVDLPNKQGQSASVRTIGDSINDTLNPPTAAAKPSGPTTTPASSVHIDPIQGQHE